MDSKLRRAAAARNQTGAATLVVVMVLLFVISLVAAYAGRNIIFEQRTSTNQMQGTLAFEAAEAGLEWALALLNSGRITESCVPSTVVADPTFRERVLAIDLANGNVTPRPRPSGGSEMWAACAIAGTALTCSCPASGIPTGLVAGAGLTPSFLVRFVSLDAPPPDQPGIVRVEVKGCTRPDDAGCMTFPTANTTRCQGTVCAMAALAPGLKTKPVAALTARGSVDVGAAALAVYNSAARARGITVRAGGAVASTPAWTLRGAPGTPGDRTIAAGDSALSAPGFTADLMFAANFGVWRETYWDQPAAVRLACGGGCDAAAVRATVALNPGRVVLANGNVTLDGGGDIGSLTEPIVLVVRGNLTFTAPTVLYGLIYAETADWATSGSGEIRGAAIAETNLSGSGAYTVVYEPDVLDNLSRRTGSFVRVPGSWKDFQ